MHIQTDKLVGSPMNPVFIKIVKMSLQFISTIKHRMAVAMFLLSSIMAGCIPYSCEKINIKGMGSISAAIEKTERQLEQLGYSHITIYSISQGKEVNSLEENDKIGKLFAAGKFRVHIEFDNKLHNGEVALCEPTNEFSLEARQKFQSLVQAMKSIFGETQIELKDSSTPHQL